MATTIDIRFREIIMKPIRPVSLVALVLWAFVAAAQVELPPAATEAIKQLEEESAAIERQVRADVKKRQKTSAAELKEIQDRLCEEDKLDQALAVRTLLRSIQSGNHDDRKAAATLPDPAEFVRDFLNAAIDASGIGLPEAARDVRRRHDKAVDDLYKDAEAKVKKYQDKAAAELEKAKEKYCKEARLDEAVAVRDLLRQVRAGGTMVIGLPDPGHVNFVQQDVGRVVFYEVTGMAGQSGYAGYHVYGTDVYAVQSYLGMAAVHAGVLKEGQTGVVKVTVLPGRSQYEGSARRGLTTESWNLSAVSFKVERPRGVAVRVMIPYLPDPGDLSHLRGNVGKSYLFEVTGSRGGRVWGADVYSDTSSLATAAVHAGVLTVGQKRVVKVTILPARDKYEGMLRNEVTSGSLSGADGSFKVEPAP